mgnify:CR=1 FL=1
MEPALIYGFRKVKLDRAIIHQRLAPSRRLYSFSDLPTTGGWKAERALAENKVM